MRDRNGWKTAKHPEVVESVLWMEVADLETGYLTELGLVIDVRPRRYWRKIVFARGLALEFDDRLETRIAVFGELDSGVMRRYLGDRQEAGELPQVR